MVSVDSNIAKFQRSGLIAWCLLASLLINLLFTMNLYVGTNNGEGKWWKVIVEDDDGLSWSRKAAAEAEAVAAVSCSGHGRAYLDGSVVDGKHVCECNTCYGGPDCSLPPSPSCSADVGSGDPLFLEPFWMQRASSSALFLPGWHRMSYSFNDKMTFSKELEIHIRKLHSIVGNAVTAGRYIIFGVGSSQLISAAVYALSTGNLSSPASVVATIPFYPMYEAQTAYFNSVDFKFQGDTSLLKNTSDSPMNVIEFVTSPNNPDGLLKKAVLGGSSVNTIHDFAYFWPHFTSIPSPADEDLMLFTLSKLTGHAGSRFGWALIKDKAVYERMVTYINMADLSFSKDTQLRACQLLKVIVEGEGKELFEFSYRKMRDRWVRLSQAFSVSKHFSIQRIPPQYCTYFQKVRGPSPAARPTKYLVSYGKLEVGSHRCVWNSTANVSFARVEHHPYNSAFVTAYAWMKCEREEDEDCTAVLEAANIIGREGSFFSADKRHVRLSLIKSQDDFELLLQRVKELVSREDGAVGTM